MGQEDLESIITCQFPSAIFPGIDGSNPRPMLGLNSHTKSKITSYFTRLFCFHFFSPTPCLLIHNTDQVQGLG